MRRAIGSSDDPGDDDGVFSDNWIIGKITDSLALSPVRINHYIGRVQVAAKWRTLGASR
mgnify:CR=1 FL=1